MTTHKLSFETIWTPPGLAYAEVYALQQKHWAAVFAEEAQGALLLVEHRPVITLGRGFHAENLRIPREEFAARGIEVIETDRGGDVTYHGPGQLTAYPIIHLQRFGLTIRGYLRRIEQTIIDTVAAYGLRGERIEGLTGVWAGAAKLAAIGIGVRKWVTYHGAALNVAPDMDAFRLIIPCGIADKPVTSLKELLGEAPPLHEVGARFDAAFRAQFGIHGCGGETRRRVSI